MDALTMKNKCLKFLGIIIAVLSVCSVTLSFTELFMPYSSFLTNILIPVIENSAFILIGIAFIFCGKSQKIAKLIPIGLFVIAFTSLIAFINTVLLNLNSYALSNYKTASIVGFFFTQFVQQGADIVLLIFIGTLFFKTKKTIAVRNLSVIFLAHGRLTYNYVISPILIAVSYISNAEVFFGYSTSTASQNTISLLTSLALILYFSFRNTNTEQRESIYSSLQA